MPRRCSNRPLSRASTGPLDAPVSKYARIAARLRHRVRPNVASFVNPLGTPALILLISLNIRFFPSPGHRLVVSGDNLLVEVPRHLDRHVFLRGEDFIEAFGTFRGDQAPAGQHRTADPVQRITRPAPVTQRLVLDPLTAQIQLPGGQIHDMERIHRLPGLLTCSDAAFV